MKLLVRWLLNTMIIMLLPYTIPGVSVAGLYAALIAALVLGLVNAIIRPIILVFTLPINVLTLGLFTFIINAALVLLTSSIVKGFYVAGFGSAFLAAVVISVFSWLFNGMVKK